MMENESIAFKTGVIYALNKIQEWITDNKDLREIESGINNTLDKIFNGFDNLFLV